MTATNAAGTSVASNAGESFSTAKIPTTLLIVENFSEYNGSDTELQSAYQANPNGDPSSVSLDSAHTDGSPISMAGQLHDRRKRLCRCVHNFSTSKNWWGYKGLQLSLQPEG